MPLLARVANCLFSGVLVGQAKYKAERQELNGVRFEQESVIQTLRSDKDLLSQRVRLLESHAKKTDEQGPDVGWDLAVQRGKKLAVAETRVVQMSSKLRLLEKQLERANQTLDVLRAEPQKAAEEEERQPSEVSEPERVISTTLKQGDEGPRKKTKRRAASGYGCVAI